MKNVVDNIVLIHAMIEKGYVKEASAKIINRIVDEYEKGIHPVYEIWDECGCIGQPSVYKHPTLFVTAAAIAAAQPKPIGPPKVGDLIQVTLTENNMTKDDDGGGKIRVTT